jgi:myo-inositol-1(or 4)-monophosphatase
VSAIQPVSAAIESSYPEEDSTPLELLQLAVDAAREAGAMLREKLGTPLNVELKSAHNDLVTDGDKASEALIAARIRAAYPDHRILAEEGTTGAEASPFRWLIDPVDGTTNFAHGVPAFAVSIGVEYAGSLLAGVVYNPAIDELFAAARGHGATLNEKPISVTRVWRPEEALVGCGMNAYNFQGRMIDAPHAFQRLTQGCRTTGAAAIDLCYVACGRFELFCGPSLAPWDVAAGTLIVREAGGEVTDFDGNPYTFERRDILASNGALHPFALKVARGDAPIRPSISAGLRRLRTRMALGVAGRGQANGRRRR